MGFRNLQKNLEKYLNLENPFFLKGNFSYLHGYNSGSTVIWLLESGHKSIRA